MAERIEICVPDIGDFEDVEVVEILVAKGDAIEFDDPLVSIESDKATMEIPSTAGGVVAEIRVAEGDRVSEGSVLVVLEGAADAATSSFDDSPAPEKVPEPAVLPPVETRPAETSAGSGAGEAQRVVNVDVACLPTKATCG